MKTSDYYLYVAVGLALLFALACILPADSRAQGNDLFDKFTQCKIDCNEIFGGIDMMPSPRAPLGHADCVLQCERRFWKDFDKGTRSKQSDED
jgi:hypothetical protein